MKIEEFMTKSRETLSQVGILYLSLKIIPNAQQTKISEVLDGEDQVLKIRVAAVPEKGKANKEIQRFLSQEFSAKKVEILAGATNVLKMVRIII